MHGGDASQVAYAVAIDPTGDIVVACDDQHASSADPQHDSWYAHTLKLTSFGTEVWSREIELQHAYAVATDDRANIAVAGSITQGGYGFVHSYDREGRTRWSHVQGPDDRAYYHALASDGTDFYATGRDHREDEPAGPPLVALRRFGATGTVAWATTVRIGEHSAQGNGIAIADGGVFATAYAYDGSDRQIFLARYGVQGDQQWTATHHSGARDVGESVAIDATGSVYVAGYVNHGDRDDIRYDAWLGKFAPSGALDWERTYDGGSRDFAHGVAVDLRDHVIVVGKTNIGTETDRHYVHWIRKYNAEGHELWTLHDGPRGSLEAVATTPTGQIIAVGQVNTGGEPDAYVGSYRP